MLYFHSSPLCFLYFLFSLKHSRAGKGIKVEVGSRLVVSLDLLFFGLPQPAPPLVDLTIWKIIRCSFEPSGKARGWRRESTVVFASPSTFAGAVNVCLSEGRGECVSIRGGVYAKAGEEVLEACDGARKLFLLLLQCRNLLPQPALGLGQSLHLTLQAGDTSM